jgi:hypothetical protein
MLPTGEEGDNGQPGPCTMLAEGDVSVQDYSSREGGEALRVPSSQAHRQPYGFIGPEFCSLPRRSRMLASQTLKSHGIVHEQDPSCQDPATLREPACQARMSPAR